jgi:hypothetical protein
MKSLLNPEVTMADVDLEPGLMVKQCPQSGGSWISSAAYWRWQERHHAASGPWDAEVGLGDDSARGPLLCPESGTLLLRYRALADVGFFVERSSATGGMWLDAGEWQALKRVGLHRHLHQVFTPAYQNHLRRMLTEQAFVAGLQRTLGADFATVAEFRGWLAEHPARARILAWLQQKS